jgi:hypothetical protein
MRKIKVMMMILMMVWLMMEEEPFMKELFVVDEIINFIIF